MYAHIKSIDTSDISIQPDEVKITIMVKQYESYKIRRDKLIRNHNTRIYQIKYLDLQFTQLICRELNKLVSVRDYIPIVIIDVTQFPLVFAWAILEEYHATINHLSSVLAYKISQYDIIAMCAGNRMQCVIIFNYNLKDLTCNIVSY